MKIAIKKEINFKNTDVYPLDELTLVYVQFKTKENNSSFYFDTIDYDHDVPYDPNTDLLSDYCDIVGDIYYYVLEYNRNGIVFTFENCQLMNPLYKVEIMELGRALEFIYSQNNFEYLENEALISLGTNAKIPKSNPEVQHLPSLENYLKENVKDFKTIYYPGAGMDFSPLQLFGNRIKDVNVFYSDYMVLPELTKMIERLEQNIENVSMLSPEDFNQQSWEDFWPDNPDARQEDYKDPAKAWGKRIVFKDDQLNCTLIYLGTEGVRTASILQQNNISIDVLVLQDHGGSTNYELFSSNDSSLHKVMQSNLPRYILMDPTGAEDTELWRGYKQVTQPHTPKIYESLPQNKKPRALFKRVG